MRIDPYLTFDGNCEEAMRFYAQALAAELVMLTRFGDSPGCEGLPPERVMHARIARGDQVLMASDNHPAFPYEGVKGCSIAINYDTVDEARRAFDALAQDGSVQMPMQETEWAHSFGMLTDRFGVPWMVNCAKPGY